MANKAVRNERRKLTATFVNGVAIAIFAVGVLAPIAAFAQSGQSNATVALLAASCVVIAGTLHWVARFLLGGMEE